MKSTIHDSTRILVLVVCCLMLIILVGCSLPIPTSVTTPNPSKAPVAELPVTVEATSAATGTSAPAATATPTPIPTVAWPMTLPVQMGTVVPVPNEPISTTNISRIVEVARWRKEDPKDAEVVCYSPDGTLLAVGTWTGIYLYDARTMELLKYVDTGERIMSLAFSPDGSLLASGPMSMSATNLTLRSTDTWEVQRKLGVSQNTVGHITFSPDGSLIAANTSIWQVNDGKKVKTLEVDQNDGYGSADFGDFSPDGKLIAVLRSGGVQYRVNQTITRKSALQIWDMNSEKVQRTIKIPDDMAITDVAFSPDGASIAAGIQIGGVNDYTKRDKATGAVRLWRVRDGALLQEFSGHTYAVRGVAFSPDGSLVASSSGSDGEVQLWQVEEGSPLKILKDDGFWRGTGASITFSPDGQTIALASSSVKIWQISDGAFLTTIGGQVGLGGQVAFSSDGARIAAGGGVVQVSDGTLITSTGVSAFSPDGSVEVIGDQVRAASDSALLFTLPYTSIIAITFSPDGSLLASASFFLDRVDVWQTSNWELVHSVEFSASTLIGGLSFSPNQSRLAVGFIAAERTMDNGRLRLAPAQPGQGNVQIWDVRAKELVTTLTKHQGAPLVAFSPDGSTLASDVGSLGGPSTVQLWNTIDWSPRKQLTWGGTFVGAAGSMAFSPDGSILATGSAEGIIRLWQVTDGKLLREIKAHNDGGVSDLEFSLDGRWLASGSWSDGTVRLWAAKP